MKRTIAISAGVLTGLLLCGGVVWAQAQSARGVAAEAIPDFSSGGRTWVLTGGTQFYKVPGDTGPGPIDDKNYPNGKFAELGGGGARTVNRIADTSNPILKPWAKKLMDVVNARVAKGGIPFVDASRCWLAGVPSLLLFPGEAMVFLQTPKEVWLLSKRDSQVRRIFMNVPHSKNPGYSMTGESVGHYENGDTLVVDTVGLNDRTYVDNFRTPHTDKLHVVERFQLVKGGQELEVKAHVEDPGTFTTPWNAVTRYRMDTRAVEVPLHEMLCAENNNDDFFHQNLVPIPQAGKPDF